MKALVPPGNWPSVRRAAPAATLPGAWAAQWAARPSSVVLTDGRDPARPATGAQMSERTASLAAVLTRHGAGPGTRVLWSARATPESVDALLAVLTAGATLVPLNPAATPAEIAHVVEDAEPTVAVTDRTDAADVFGPGVVALSVDDLTTTTSRATFAPPPLGADDDALIVYTSGTTGRPKGIRRPLSGADPEAAVAPMVTVVSQIMGVPTGEGVQLVTGPMYHATPGSLATLGLHMGHTLVLMDKWEPQRALELVERYRVSYMHMVPTMFQRLLALPEEVKRSYDTSSLRCVVHGAAPCPKDVKMRMIDWFGPIINEYYGSSEGGGASVGAEDWLKRPGTVGLPWPGAAIRIYDENGWECPPNQAGEVYIKMPGFEFEYHNAPEKTRDSTRDGFFTVGDVGYLDEDGYLFLSGRSTELIISGGVNIYPAEIEGYLAAHPAVADVGVIGVPNQEWGEEVKAVVQLREGVEPSAELADELIAHCRDGLAGYKVPRSVDFREALPRTETGKLYKRLLREEYWASAGRQL